MRVIEISFFQCTFAASIKTKKPMIGKFDLQKKEWQWISLIFLSMLWGSSFILMKKGLESFSNFQLAALRMFIAFVFFIPVIISRFKELTKLNAKHLAIVGIIGNGIPAVLFATAQTQISSSLAGILNSITPLFSLLIGLLFYKAATKRHNIAGVLIGFVGAVGLIAYDASDLLNFSILYSLLIVVATFFYGVSLNEIKYKLNELNGLSVTALSFMFVGPFAGIYLLFSDFSAALASSTFTGSLVAIVILAVFSSVVAVAVFNYLIKFTTAIFAASVTYIIPVFALMWGIADGEHISFFDMIWIAIILIGVYLVNIKQLKFSFQKTPASSINQIDTKNNVSHHLSNSTEIIKTTSEK